MIVESFPRYALQNTQTFIRIVSMFIRLSKKMHFHKYFEELFTKGQLILATFSFNLSRNIRAVYTRENKPPLTIAAAYVRLEGNHLYEYGLHKTRTTRINGSRLSTRPDRSSDDVVCFGASCNLRQWLEQAKQRNDWLWSWKLPYFTVFFVSN